MIQVSRLDHVAISSRDPERSIGFYRDVLGMTLEHDWPGEVTALKAGDSYLAISWKNQGKPASLTSIHHFAFRVDRKSFEEAKTSLPSQGINIKIEDNGINHSIYFHDPDNHLIELACYEPESFQ